MPFSLKNYGMVVTHLNGTPIDWERPPRDTLMVKWSKRTISGKEIRGSFRSICHLDRLNRLAYRRWGVGIQVIQSAWNTTVAASKGTHDYDSVFDVWIPGVDPWVQQRFFRRNGLGGWMRKPPLFGWHYHGFTLPVREGKNVNDDWKLQGFKVGIYVDGGYSITGSLVTSSQIEDYYNRAFGLANQHAPNSDKSWHPSRTGGGIPATVFNLQSFVNNRVKEQRRAA